MQIVTIACAETLTDPAINHATAPIWTDASGTQYHVASGLLDGYVQTEPVAAQANRVNVIVGLTGLEALAAMGLTNNNQTET